MSVLCLGMIYFLLFYTQSDSNKHLNVIPQKLTFLKSSYGGLMHFFRQALHYLSAISLKIIFYIARARDVITRN